MSTVISRVQARKALPCTVCGAEIESGSTYTRSVTFHDGSASTWSLHPICGEAVNRVPSEERLARGHAMSTPFPRESDAAFCRRMGWGVGTVLAATDLRTGTQWPDRTITAIGEGKVLFGFPEDAWSMGQCDWRALHLVGPGVTLTADEARLVITALEGWRDVVALGVPVTPAMERLALLSAAHSMELLAERLRQETA